MNATDQNVITFDLNIYSLKAVKRAIYDLGIAADISYSDGNNEKVHVKILSEPNGLTDTDIKLKVSVLDHEVRIDVEKEFGPLRKIIIAQAFFPCENLDKLLNEIGL